MGFLSSHSGRWQVILLEGDSDDSFPVALAPLGSVGQLYSWTGEFVLLLRQAVDGVSALVVELWLLCHL